MFVFFTGGDDGGTTFFDDRILWQSVRIFGQFTVDSTCGFVDVSEVFTAGPSIVDLAPVEPHRRPSSSSSSRSRSASFG